MLTHPDTRSQLQHLMDQTIQYLGAQSQFSPYARHYHSILLDLMASVFSLHDRQDRRRRASKLELLDRMLNVETDQSAICNSGIDDTHTAYQQTQRRHLDAGFAGDRELLESFAGDDGTFLAAWSDLMPGITAVGDYDVAGWSGFLDNIQE